MERLMLFALFLLLFQTDATADLALRKDIGEMVMVGFRGTELSDTSRIIRDINTHFIGSVVLFDYDVPSKTPVRNVLSRGQVRQLLADLNALTPHSVLVAVDQEGGMVQRFKEKHGFSRFLTAAKLGEKNDAAFTERQARLLAAELRDVGVHLNLAPVVDVNTNPKNPVIAKYERSFSSDWREVASHAAAAINGHHAEDVGVTLKHFPGHGSSTGDSHFGVVDVSDTWAELELNPYKSLIEKGHVDAVMTAHVFLKKYDRNYPATMSKPILTGILRDRLGFTGVIISDDMNMEAIATQYGRELALEKAINGGVDLLVFGNNLGEYDPNLPRKVCEEIYALVKQGEVSPARIRAAASRVKKLKQRLIKP